MKAGIVAILGRPNVGKSTLLNNLLGHKVAITSPKPQTTRFPIQAAFEDERGQIIFIDTPGIFGSAPDHLAQSVNLQAEEVLRGNIDVLVYLIDTTRARDVEENKVLGLVRQATCPKILVLNKIDIKQPDYSAEYAFYEDEFDTIVKVSAITKKNLNLLIDAIFAKLPEREKLTSANLKQPALNMDSKLFVSEIVREKVFLFMQEEVPYTVLTRVDEISERTNNLLYIKAAIITTADRYKKMLIGVKGRMIKKIGMAVRKELETATGKQIFIDLTVEVNPHWQEAL
jgi:GTP-binding protein Era